VTTRVTHPIATAIGSDKPLHLIMLFKLRGPARIRKLHDLLNFRWTGCVSRWQVETFSPIC